MKIGIIGGGISGIYAAHKLAPRHDVCLYEAQGYLGGHTDTHHVTMGENVCSVDTGFIVFNESNYPLFSSFLHDLDVKSRPSNMSFSVSDRRSGLEYNATSLSGLFCRRSNAIRPGFYRMLFDIGKFYRRAPALLESDHDELTIGEYLVAEGYGKDFINNHLIPMASALWSSPSGTVSRFPARYFVAFMQNHKMLQIANRPSWRTIAGGSSKYVEAFTRRYRGQLRVGSRVCDVKRVGNGVRVKTDADNVVYDELIMACHSDQALRILGDANERERAALSAVPYQQNEIALHTDRTLMPDNPGAWASWNVIRPREDNQNFVVSYCMNLLQGIDTRDPLLVTLNATDMIEREKILLTRSYDHPVYTPESMRARRELRACSGSDGVHFTGAYLGWGFHEDGARSAQRVIDAIEGRFFSRAA